MQRLLYQSPEVITHNESDEDGQGAERLGVRLLSRTIRSVSTTEAGEKQLRSLRPALDEITAGVDEVGALLGKPSGTVRLTATKHGVTSVVMPILPRFLASHPDIRVDIIADDNLADTVADRIDAGIRFGYIVEKDMIAVRIGPDIQMAVVGALSYFVDRPVPRTPRDLAGHRCINYGHIRSGGFYAWNPRRREGASRCVSIARIQADKQQLSKSLNFRKKIGCVPDLLARSKLRKASVPPAAIRRSS